MGPKSQEIWLQDYMKFTQLSADLFGQFFELFPCNLSIVTSFVWTSSMWHLFCLSIAKDTGNNIKLLG